MLNFLFYFSVEFFLLVNLKKKKTHTNIITGPQGVTIVCHFEVNTSQQDTTGQCFFLCCVCELLLVFYIIFVAADYVVMMVCPLLVSVVFYKRKEARRYNINQPTIFVMMIKMCEENRLFLV